MALWFKVLAVQSGGPELGLFGLHMPVTPSPEGVETVLVGGGAGFQFS